MLFERSSKSQIPDIELDNGVVYRRNRNPRQIPSTNEQNQNDNSTPGQSGFSHSLEVNAHDTATHTHTHTLTAFQLYMQPSQRMSILFQELYLPTNICCITSQVSSKSTKTKHPSILVLKNFLCIGVTLYWISDSDILVE